MVQSFRNHRLHQVLSWVDALSRGYDTPDSRQVSAENPIWDGPHRTPTVSNLAYYLLTDAEYNQDTLKDQFSRHEVLGDPTKNMFKYVKQDITRHLTQYPSDLFTNKRVQKTPKNHPSFDDGFESRQVKAKAYYLTERGRNRLAELTDLIQFKSELVTTKQTKRSRDRRVSLVNKEHCLTGEAIDHIVGEVSSKSVEIDLITVPVKERWDWELKTYTLPHISVVDRTRDTTPKIYRD